MNRRTRTRLNDPLLSRAASARALWLGGLLLACWAPLALSHGGASSASKTAGGERQIQFPNVPGYQTLVVDLHSHSVFSDGHVWPKIRIEEALRDGLDGFAVTEHLEWQPHRADIPHPDRNRAYQIAAAAAEGSELIVIAGSEITRELPSGHINAVFITDANALLQIAGPPADAADTIGYYRQAGQWPAAEAIAAANAQNAFVFMNHPDWTRQRANGIAQLTPLQRKLIKSNQIHGIEIANGDGFSEQALTIGLKRKLTLLGVSDIHDLIDWDYPPSQGAHRPVTVVFAQQRSAASIQEALMAQRNVVWFKNRLIGRAPVLQPLLEASLTITNVAAIADTETVAVTFNNVSDMHFELRNHSRYSIGESDDRFAVPAHSERTVTVKPGAAVSQLSLELEVENALVGPKSHAHMTFALQVPAATSGD